MAKAEGKIFDYHDESHIDAKRYLHRRKLQRQTSADVAEDETSSGFFGRLFGKK